jgi:hypothetical protein
MSLFNSAQALANLNQELGEMGRPIDAALKARMRVVGTGLILAVVQSRIRVTAAHGDHRYVLVVRAGSLCRSHFGHESAGYSEPNQRFCG